MPGTTSVAPHRCHHARHHAGHHAGGTTPVSPCQCHDAGHHAGVTTPVSPRQCHHAGHHAGVTMPVSPHRCHHAGVTKPGELCPRGGSSPEAPSSEQGEKPQETRRETLGPGGDGRPVHPNGTPSPASGLVPRPQLHLPSDTALRSRDVQRRTSLVTRRSGGTAGHGITASMRCVPPSQDRSYDPASCHRAGRSRRLWDGSVRTPWPAAPGEAAGGVGTGAGGGRSPCEQGRGSARPRPGSRRVSLSDLGVLPPGTEGTGGINEENQQNEVGTARAAATPAAGQVWAERWSPGSSGSTAGIARAAPRSGDHRVRPQSPRVPSDLRSWAGAGTPRQGGLLPPPVLPAAGGEPKRAPRSSLSFFWLSRSR